MFEIRADQEHPTITAEGLQYEGRRYRAEARLAGRLYGSPFGVDIALAEPLVGEPEWMMSSSYLSFAGVVPTKFRVYPVETHIAEKFHAYTLPRPRPNSRVKDLPDIALLAQWDRSGRRASEGQLRKRFGIGLHIPRRHYFLRHPLPGKRCMRVWPSRMVYAGVRLKV